MSFPSRLSSAFVCAALLCALSGAGSAQGPAPAGAPAAAAPPAQVEVVLTGGKGRAAPELKREDVRVFADGVERPVVSFEKRARPVSYGLVVDNSGSLRSQIARVADAAKFLVAQHGPDDQAFVLRFVSSDNIRILQTLTADKAALDRALDSMLIQGGQTALLDALYVAGEYLTKDAGAAAGAPGRGLALVLVSDGEDRVSAHKAEEVLKLLKEGGVRVYCVALTGALEDERGLISQSKRQRAKDLLSKIAGETGGRVFYVEKGGELGEAVGDVAGSIRTRYVVGYTPEAGGRAGDKVEVRVVGAPGKETLKARIVSPAEKDK